ncbi:DMT family transporter [Mitsuokella sp.]|uniref:DMT family transporter n=1 Tax=Mitsuokella sp. TaxID=2049034 RepID=UPI003D7EEEA4
MHLRGNLMLLLAAFIWGTTFVAQMVGMEGLGPFTYAAARYILGFLFLVGLWYTWKGPRETAKRAGTYHAGWKAGLGAGCIMFVATSLQQVAMLYTTAGKTAFITALYIILVPLGAVLLGKRIHIENWIGAFLALAGLYFLSIHGEVALSFGDGLVLISAFFWTGHILFIDRFASLVDPIELSTTQVGVCAAGSLVAALLFETIAVQPIFSAWFAIFYGGVMSAGVAFTLQILGQQYAEPGQAAIIMSFEAVFGVLSSWLLLGEQMTIAQIMGCVLMLAGMIITQIRPLLKDRRRMS